MKSDERLPSVPYPYGPVAILDGIPDGWVECDGKNGTPRVTEESLERLREEKRKIDGGRGKA